MRVQSRERVLGRPVFDARGRRLGVVVDAACPDTDPYDVIWVLVRLRGWWGRRLRVLPLAEATFGRDGGLQVSYDRTLITATEPADRHALTDARFLHRVAGSYRCQP